MELDDEDIAQSLNAFYIHKRGNWRHELFYFSIKFARINKEADFLFVCKLFAN
jgi:hypothetical protein